jgi:hypothetical protein
VQKSAQEYEKKGDRLGKGLKVGSFAGWNVWDAPLHPPMKMDGYQKKGVAREAFCKWLK